jgi:Bacterial PH domain
MFRSQRRRLSLTDGTVYSLVVAGEVALRTVSRGHIPDWIYALIVLFTVALVVGAVRAFRTATTKADADGLTVRGFFRTHSVRWGQVTGYSALRTRSGLSGRRGATAIIELADGRRVRLGEFFLVNNARALDRARKIPLMIASHVHEPDPV